MQNMDKIRKSLAVKLKEDINDLFEYASGIEIVSLAVIALLAITLTIIILLASIKTIIALF